jgi:hypothetical protein
MSTLIDNGELLMDDRLAPITTCMGFLEAQPKDAAREFAVWQAEVKSELGVSVETLEVRGAIEEVLLSLLPLRTAGATRRLFVPTTGNWTAYFDNGYRGTDPAAIAYMAQRLSCRTIWVVAKPHSLRSSGTPRKGRQGALIIEVYGPGRTENINLIRAIRLQNDAGNWEFNAHGAPLPFEETEKYSSRRKTDRFTFDMMTRYLAKLGLNPFDAEFYLPPSRGCAILVELSGNLPSSGRDVPLPEARKLNGIED